MKEKSSSVCKNDSSEIRIRKFPPQTGCHDLIGGVGVGGSKHGQGRLSNNLSVVRWHTSFFTDASRAQIPPHALPYFYKAHTSCMHQQEDLWRCRVEGGGGGGIFHLLPTKKKTTNVRLPVCLHLLGSDLLAWLHVCSLSEPADRQRGQTGCYKTQPGEEKIYREVGGGKYVMWGFFSIIREPTFSNFWFNSKL